MAAKGGCEETSDEILNFKCTPCSKLNRQKEAVKYCVECQGYCCQSCVDMHLAFPAISGHKLLDKSSFKSTTLTTNLPSVPTEICSKHEIKILDMYCGNHDVVGCTSCMSLDHRSCADVKLISDVVDTIFQKTDADKTHLTLREKKIAVEKIKTSREALLEELNKSRTNAVNEIREFRAEIEKVLEKIEKESITEVEKEYQTMNAMLLEEIETSENQIKELKQAEEDMQQSDGNVAQQFVSMKTAQKMIAQTEVNLNSFDAYPHAQVSFAADRSVLEFLQGLETFGTIIRNTAYSVKGTREMNIKIQSDTSTCAAYGSCLTPGGELLLPDFNNKKLKRFDIVKLSIVDYCDLPYIPCGVCCTDQQEAVVTLLNNSIQFIALDRQMKPTHGIKLNHDCRGIAYKDRKLFITNDGNSLFIHDMTGTLLQTISKDNSGNDLFTQCRQIAFSDFGDKVYVADYRKNIVTLDSQGKHCSNYVDSDFDNGTGVCTDRRGNLFACAYQSRDVMQIGTNGQKMGIVVKPSDRLSAPCSLTFSPQLCTLFVSEEKSDKVKLFDLQ